MNGFNRVVAPAIALLLACEAAPEPSDEPPPLIEAELEAGYPALAEPCRGPVAEPTHLVVTSTDFNTGAVGLVEIATREVAADLALASSDAVALVEGERVFVLNRFGFDYVDELAIRHEPSIGLELVHEFAVAPVSAELPANPQAIALDPEGRGWLSLYGAGELQQIRFPTLTAARPRASLALDLRGFADGDGVPELGGIVGCGELLFVAANRIDRGAWVPADETLLIPVGVGDEPRLFDFDTEREGADALRLLGAGFGRWRVDPGDPTGRTIVALNSGLERIDLGAGTSEWLVDEEVFAEAGYGRLQLSDFDFDAQGRIWVSAATEDYSEFRILRIELGGEGPELLIEVEGLQSVTGALEVVGEEAWFADTTIGASGLRVFALAKGAVVEVEGSPFAVGLPPMSVAGLAR